MIRIQLAGKTGTDDFMRDFRGFISEDISGSILPQKWLTPRPWASGLPICIVVLCATSWVRLMQ